MTGFGAGEQSRVALLPGAEQAYALRASSARAARRTLDLQYYMWRADVTGRLLASEILAAADRGVLVRLLLDDVYALGRERVLGALDAHPNITVRLFNGTRWRRFGRLGLLLEIALGGWYLNRRMHNKNWIMDGRLAIVGGRNIGDEYFDRVEEGTVAFRDLDIAILGEAASQATQVFNRYWQSRLARPATDVTATASLPESLPRLRRQLATTRARHAADARLAALFDPPEHPHWPQLMAVDPRCIQVVADPPDKARRGLHARKRARAAGGIAAEIADALRLARHEALLISPYFVPGRAGLALLRTLRSRGVRVSVVTNSLAATDVVAVHGGYARYRRALLDAGITLFELKPTQTEERTSLLGSRGAALHTKAFVVDGVLAFVGSFNLDPRSAALNTEMGAFVRHRRVAGEVAAEHSRLADPSRSWQVVWEAGRLAWREGDGTLLRREPLAGWWRRTLAGLVRRLPVEEQL